MALPLRDVVADGLLRIADWATRTACRLRPDLATRPAPPGRAVPAAPEQDPMDLAPETPDASDFPPDFPPDAPEHWRDLLRNAGRPAPNPPPAPRPAPSGRVIALCPANHRGTPTVTLRPSTQTSPVRPEAGAPSPSSGRTAPGPRSAPPGTGNDAGAGNVAGSHAGPTSGAGPDPAAEATGTGPGTGTPSQAGVGTAGSRQADHQTAGPRRAGRQAGATRPLGLDAGTYRRPEPEAGTSRPAGPDPALHRSVPGTGTSRQVEAEVDAPRRPDPATVPSREVGPEPGGPRRLDPGSPPSQAGPWPGGSPGPRPARTDRAPSGDRSHAAGRPLASGDGPERPGTLRARPEPAPVSVRIDPPATGGSRAPGDRQVAPRTGWQGAAGTPSDPPRKPAPARAVPVEFTPAREPGTAGVVGDPATGDRPPAPAVSVRPARGSRPAQAAARNTGPVWPDTATTTPGEPRPAGNWPELLEDTAVSTPDPREERRVARLIAEQEGTPWNA